MPRPADRFYLIAPDYPGFERSGAPAPGAFHYTFDHLTQIVDALLGQQRISRYSLYLQDYGGPIEFRRHRGRGALAGRGALCADEPAPQIAELIRDFFAVRRIATERSAE